MPLEPFFKNFRLTVCDFFGRVRARGEAVLDSWLELEQKAKRNFESVVAPGERRISESGPVLVTALAGMILVRNRGFVTRLLFPLTCGAVAFSLAYPETSRQIYSRVDQRTDSVEALKPVKEAAKELKSLLEKVF